MYVFIYMCMYVYICIYLSTDGGNWTQKNYDCQNLQQVFMAVPVHIKHVFTGVFKFSHKFSRL